MEQKVDEAMVAVGDETGLRKLIGSDDFSDSASSDDDDPSKFFPYNSVLPCFYFHLLLSFFLHFIILLRFI